VGASFLANLPTGVYSGRIPAMLRWGLGDREGVTAFGAE
jgi:hypothetical protein